MKMLNFVTKQYKNTQLYKSFGFIIYVGLFCIGGNGYA